jgi:hypothetical protein
MASKHCGVSPLGRVTARRRLRWRRRLGFEPLEERRLLAVIPVTTTMDENNGTGLVSLREAVGSASTGDTITFSVNGTIQLLGGTGFGQITIGKSLTIQGPGANLLTIRAFDPDINGTNNSNGARVFLVDNSLALLDVTISGLTLTNGDPTVADVNDGGGAILNNENLTLNACVLTGNFAGADGGAVLVSDGSLTVTQCTIVNNEVTNSGGGILAQTRPVTIVNSTISGNFANESGGGLYVYSGSISVTGSSISGNSADNNHDGFGSGGGIFSSLATISVSNSTISGNSAGEHGGGVFSATSQPVSFKFSTITGNVVANLPGSSGGGIHSANLANLDHTIVAGNLLGASTRDDLVGAFDAYYSLIGDKRNESVNNVGGSLIGTTAVPIDAKLGPLANNGGLTSTHALLSGSPAIDAGNPPAIAGSGGVPQFDQRGTPFSRVVDFDGMGGARIDIGAVEIAAAGPALPGDYNLNHSVDAADYVLWRKTNGTNMSQAYSGADGDGNSAVNSNDYAVWRGHFGNSSAGAGAAASEPWHEPVGSESAAVASVGADASLLAFADLAKKPLISTALVAVIRADQLVSTDEAGSADLLLIVGRAAGGVNQAFEADIQASAIELVGADAMWDGAIELSSCELNAPIVAL